MTVRIENEELLTARFGRWPGFHDAEIIRARFEREGQDAPFLECDIHVFEMTRQVDSTGHYVLKHHTLVTIRFGDIGLECFQGWNHQNVLWDLIIEPAEPGKETHAEYRPVQVEFSSSYGCAAKLKCRNVRVMRATEFDAESQ